MRPDRPLITAALCLGGGVALIVEYCHGATSLSAAYPFSGSMLHIDLTTYGPAVFGGLALLTVGVLLLVWAVLAAIVSQFRVLAGRDDRYDSILERGREDEYEDEHYPGAMGMTARRHES